MNTHKKTQNEPQKLFFLPAMLLLIVWPCLVHMDQIKTGLEEMPWYPDLAVQNDFFMHIRSVSFLIICILMAGVLFDRMVIQRTTKLDLRRAWPLLSYAFLALLSALFSVNRDLSFGGSTEQFESVWVLLGYVIVCWYFADTVSRFGRRAEKILLCYFLIGAAVQGLIGLSQILGCDFWSSLLGRKLILLGQDSSQLLDYTFAEKGTTQVYMSFYNPNYAAVYLILILPLVVYGLFFFRKKWQKSLIGMVLFLLLLCLWKTGSEAGLITLCVLVFAGILLCFKDWKKKIVFSGAGILILTGTLALNFVISKDPVLVRLRKNVFPEQKSDQLQEVNLEQDAVQITYNGDTYRLRLTREDEHIWFSVSDAQGQDCRLDYDETSGCFSFADHAGIDLAFQAYADSEMLGIIMYHQNISWQFEKKDETSSFEYITVYGKADTIENADYAFGEGYERAFTWRFYLWSRTVPLLKHYLLLGSGPDTFLLVFPQNDYVARANTGKKLLTEIISRPHSYYLQTAVQTGMLSLVLLLFFFGRYFLTILKKKQKHLFAITIMLSVFGFLIMGLLNDSVVVTAPIFWAILGLGSGVTRTTV